MDEILPSRQPMKRGSASAKRKGHWSVVHLIDPWVLPCSCVTAIFALFDSVRDPYWAVWRTLRYFGTVIYRSRGQETFVVTRDYRHGSFLFLGGFCVCTIWNGNVWEERFIILKRANTEFGLQDLETAKFVH